MVATPFWIRNVVLDNARNDLRSQDFAEKVVAANARDLATTFRPFYGEAASDRLHTLLPTHYEAVKAHSLTICERESTAAGFDKGATHVEHRRDCLIFQRD